MHLYLCQSLNRHDLLIVFTLSPNPGPKVPNFPTSSIKHPFRHRLLPERVAAPFAFQLPTGHDIKGRHHG